MQFSVLEKCPMPSNRLFDISRINESPTLSPLYGLLRRHVPCLQPRNCGLPATARRRRHRLGGCIALRRIGTHRRSGSGFGDATPACSSQRCNAGVRRCGIRRNLEVTACVRLAGADLRQPHDPASTRQVVRRLPASAALLARAFCCTRFFTG